MDNITETQLHQQVFISYSSRNRNIADAICSGLENSDIRCWIAPRAILPGNKYTEVIIDAFIPPINHILRSVQKLFFKK